MNKISFVLFCAWTFAEKRDKSTIIAADEQTLKAKGPKRTMLLSQKSSTFAKNLKNNTKYIMINLQQEIENCLKTLRNTNNKEQNFQGRLYAYFLKFEEKGYIVEMETNVRDKHVSPLFSSSNHKKKEIDLLIYKSDYSEKYAIELKWSYDPGFHYLDRLSEFEKDVEFVRELVQNDGFNETCSVIVVDIEHITKLKSNRINHDSEKAFEEGIICGEKFGPRKKLYDAYEYIIIPFKK